MSTQHSAAEEHGKRHKQEGPRKHIIAFIFSILLTVIAFAAVSAGEINQSFVYIILVLMAVLQVFIQMSFWMHMKDRGHIFPIMGILMGVFVVFTLVVMAEYWAWWG
ncbi:cytochrome C oxidase subunit IV family protein [Paenibacillus sp. sptzw28]|uniref:cytochrome C oxidase subunit IV family protein n=1 Tax=Paenibacillus sp. sptzw28 TaxID=715179 RepID=UPI001C6E5DEA|nr:cytochrome C oxidase subunit IV family protein [Paenibacillus sp. sptzw28]QYR22613.1 cytochrome C oxidase subunit IV family protein [Paenibacillus sp. sptzw28]